METGSASGSYSGITDGYTWQASLVYDAVGKDEEIGIVLQGAGNAYGPVSKSTPMFMSLHGGGGIAELLFPIPDGNSYGLAEIADAADSVPEPKSVALMLVGLGLIGSIGRKRRQ